MTRRAKTYLASAVVFGASFVLAWVLPIPEVVRVLAIMPGFGALANVVFILWREELAHERAVELQERQQDFALATASHMASVAYDKHVKFCEEYIETTNRGFVELMKSGPSLDAVQLGNGLATIRLRHTAWLTSDIESKLEAFEAALRKMGAAEHRLETLDVGEERTKLVDENLQRFLIFAGEKKPENEGEAAVAREKVIDHLREVLGIKQLTELRQNATRVAITRLAGGGRATTN